MGSIFDPDSAITGKNFHPLRLRGSWAICRLRRVLCSGGCGRQTLIILLARQADRLLQLVAGSLHSAGYPIWYSTAHHAVVPLPCWHSKAPAWAAMVATWWLVNFRAGRTRVHLVLYHPPVRPRITKHGGGFSSHPVGSFTFQPGIRYHQHRQEHHTATIFTAGLLTLHPRLRLSRFSPLQVISLLLIVVAICRPNRMGSVVLLSSAGRRTMAPEYFEHPWRRHPAVGIPFTPAARLPHPPRLAGRQGKRKHATFRPAAHHSVLMCRGAPASAGLSIMKYSGSAHHAMLDNPFRMVGFSSACRDESPEIQRWCASDDTLSGHTRVLSGAARVEAGGCLGP